ncbi:dTDP-4-dehydrorhamnose reductase [Nitratidesulfovibrio vulgaris]|uniref:dTDP-4-dehydrorhamnose reductase n=1 Tax=Nitratidesulfovibrio vulgaris (strain DP4) TaxID=391774 RepID=A0A0H3A8T9_NITV4|nr:dTDP-4-dehydrorhamnose reductase [Nitratidesulfovibrio vulgaris]ABM28722.1 dTDP-4-dehydrorhamnose reductase [Nitratidesulfovibrio vulgaris DP4]GEB79105.1 NAD(P)-dependent oxidoreductase [Desulfovibrio desulfuricans]
MTARPRAVVLGGRTGLLGQSLVLALRNGGWDAVPVGRDDVDVLDAERLADFIDKASPQAVFNTVAWTQVDLAEEHEQEAAQLNRALPASLGRIVRGTGMHLVHLSTDFVFNGRKTTPYTTDDTPDPASVYGTTKLAGETALLSIAPDNCCVVRTAWLFGPGRRNFVQTILGLCAAKDDIQVVHDQTGSPTYTVDLAAGCVRLAELRATGLFHVVNAGQASWCELASEAVHLAGLHCKVHAITSKDWPQKAARPAYSVLDTSRFTEVTGIVPRPWPQALRDYIYKDCIPSGN